MRKIIKTFLFFLGTVLLIAPRAYCMDEVTREHIKASIKSQKPLQDGNLFPKVSYYHFANHRVAPGVIPDLKTIEYGPNLTIYIVIPGAGTATCEEKHIPQFVAAYNDRDDFLCTNKVRTYIISHNDAAVMARWATQLNFNNPLLDVIADPDGSFIRQLGVLDRNEASPWLGTFGKRSAVYVNLHGLVLGGVWTEAKKYLGFNGV